MRASLRVSSRSKLGRGCQRTLLLQWNGEEGAWTPHGLPSSSKLLYLYVGCKIDQRTVSYYGNTILNTGIVIFSLIFRIFLNFIKYSHIGFSEVYIIFVSHHKLTNPPLCDAPGLFCIFQNGLSDRATDRATDRPTDRLGSCRPFSTKRATRIHSSKSGRRNKTFATAAQRSPASQHILGLDRLSKLGQHNNCSSSQIPSPYPPTLFGSSHVFRLCCQGQVFHGGPPGNLDVARGPFVRVGGRHFQVVIGCGKFRRCLFQHTNRKGQVVRFQERIWFHRS